MIICSTTGLVILVSGVDVTSAVGANFAVNAFASVFPIAIIIGSLAAADFVWTLQDCALGLLIIPNIITLVIMAPKVGRLTKEFFQNYDSPRLICRVKKSNMIGV